MASITIRKIEDAVKRQLKDRAAAHGCSMEEEVRRILQDTLSRERPQSLTQLAKELFGPEHGVDLPEYPRVDQPRVPDFGET
jgi:plasmid stability protein